MMIPPEPGRDYTWGMPTPLPMFAPASTEAAVKLLVIAELGVNHDGSVTRAVELVRAAGEAGADAVKMQLFDPRRLLSKQAVLAEYQKAAADDAFAMLDRLKLNVAQMTLVRDAARAAGLAFIVTPFSLEDARSLAGLDVDAVKLASPDAVNTPLLEAAAALGRPMLISTGTCLMEELEPAAALLRGHGAGGAMLQCVSSYPTPGEDAALGAMVALRERFGLPTGYSDHTEGETTGALAVAAGACVLEKHLTYDRAAAGPDHAASLEPAGMARYVRLAREAAAMLGPIRKRVLPVEEEVRRVSRQSVCATRDLPAGHVLTREDLTVRRPGTGIPAARLSATVGRRLARPVRSEHLLSEGDLT